MAKSSMPKWLQEIESFKGIKSTFILEGNINDFYPVKIQKNSDTFRFKNMNDTLLRTFNPNLPETVDYDFLFCDPSTGFYSSSNDRIDAGNLHDMIQKYDDIEEGGQSVFKNISDRIFNNSYRTDDIERLSNTIKNAIADGDRERPVAIVMNFASQYISSPDHLSPEENKMFLNLLFASLNSKKIHGFYNTLIMVVEKYNDLPAWFFYNNPNVRTISVSNPDKNAREVFIKDEFKAYAENEAFKKEFDKFIDVTDGLKNREIREIDYLYKRLLQENPETDILDAVSLYKYGIVENAWNSIEPEKIKNLEENLKKRVKGQDLAVSKTVNIVKRAVLGFSGLQHSSGQNKPRGILFFAGPTGTGKTELTKALAEQLFGDENNCIRFDMSEYADAASDQKLFGAPPGYVGYEAGGQLTNAIKERPFSILLFDEIEKADPSIMDKFLQILEDGRMTDGQGNTVYFSESLIIFTSNLGITRLYKDRITGEEKRDELVTPDEPYDEIRPKVINAIRAHFKPEVLNRIGDNIVVFDFIRPDTSKAIVMHQFETINEKVLKQNKIKINASDEVINYFCEKANAMEVLSMGGRGIGNLMESEYINPMAEYISEHGISEGQEITPFISDGKLDFR